MENSTQALLMAASILLLIIALTVSISSLTSLKTQVDSIISEEEEVKFATYTDSDGEVQYVNYIKNADEIRTVGVETIISTVRRIRREEYTVYIAGDVVSEVKSNSSGYPTIYDNYITELEEGQNYEGTSIINSGENVIMFSISSSGWKNIDSTLMEELYALTTEKNFKEYLGIYQTNEEVSDANKETYRVVTYVQT